MLALLSTSLSFAILLSGQETKRPVYPSFDYDAARTHEIKPHRRTIPHEGVHGGFNQLHLSLVVSTEGAVLQANAEGEEDLLRLWPELKSEVMQWKFAPFEKDGNVTIATVEEYIDLVPPERLPRKHFPAPPVRPQSQVSIALERTGCFGSCPDYTVRVTTAGIVFDGGGFVAARGRHRAKVDPAAVRELAKKFIAVDFYSMDPAYIASVTDCPTYTLSIDVDGNVKQVEDYVGAWVGMPSAISQLEDEVDNLAQTQRWIEGSEGLVSALRAEGFHFKTYDAQAILKEAAGRGQTDTVKELLDADVPLKALPALKPKSADEAPPIENAGWLTAASRNPATLKVLLDAGADENDQNELDRALLNAARGGKLESVKTLIDAGADPNADFTNQIDEESTAGMTAIFHGGAGSVLIGAAYSGNPDVVREILRYHPDLEARDRSGKTALIAASEDEGDAPDEARAECVRLLAEAGANVNAKDNDGNTALHETFITPVEEELLKLGADVNARNNDGETPLFTTVDHDAIPLYIKHGANLEVRNNKGQTAAEAAQKRGPYYVEAFRKALEHATQPQARPK